MANCEDVKRAGLSLPNVEEGTSYGTAALKVKGKLLVRLREEGDVIVLKMPHDLRTELMEGDPDTYFITDHYESYEWILVIANRSVARPAAHRLSRGYPETPGEVDLLS